MQTKNKATIKFRQASLLGLLFFVVMTILFFSIRSVHADLLNNYSKNMVDTLEAYEWNQLVADFVKKNDGGDVMLGNYGVNMTASSTNAFSVSGGVWADLLKGNNLLVSGNIGIGTTTAPSYRFQIFDNTGDVIHTTGGQISGLPSVQTEDGQAISRKYLHDNFLSTSTPISTNFWDGSLLGNISNANSGNVGIGTTTPSEKLYVHGGSIFVINSAGQDSIKISGRAGGTANHVITIMPATLNANRTVTIPDASFIVAGTNITQTISGLNTFSSSSGVRISHSNGSLNFTSTTANVKRINVTAGNLALMPAGNVGIGTTEPNSKLSITSSTNITDITDVATSFLNIRNTGSTANKKFGITFGYSDAYPVQAGIYTNADHSNNANASLLFATRGTTGSIVERMRIDSAGNVGIGTTSPNYKLKVAGITSDIINTSGGQISGLPSVQTEPDQAVSRKYLHDNFLSTSTPTSTNFWGGSLLGDISNANSGNVGIGTSNPLAKLHLLTAYNNVFRFNDGSGNITPNISIGGPSTKSMALLSGSAGSVFTFDNTGFFGIYSDSKANIDAGTSGGGSARMVVTSSGNVGIGTTNPAEKLTVFGGVSTQANSSVTGSNFSSVVSTFGLYHRLRGASAGISGNQYVNQLISYAGNGLEIYTNATQPLVFGTNATERMRIIDGGNVGIGTTAPSAKLDVSGVAARGTELMLITGTGEGGGTLDAKKGLTINVPVGAHEASLLDINAGVTPILRVMQKSGNVGIGTTSPNYKLKVAGITSDIINTSGGQISGLPSVQTEPDQAVSRKYLHDNFLSTSTPTSTNFWGGSLLGDISNANSGNVGIGTTNPSVKLHVSDEGAVIAAGLLSGTSPTILASGQGKNLLNQVMVASNSATQRPIFNFARSRGTLSSPSVVVNNDQLGDLLFGGYDGTAMQSGGGVFAYVDGTVSSGNVPTRISFVTGSNSSNRQERLTIKSNGDVGIGTTNPGAKLEVSSSTKKLLFDPASSSISSPNSSDIKLLANSQNIFRGLDNWTGTWSDSVITTYFQTGRSGGNTAFSTFNGVAYNRLAFMTNKFQVTNFTGGITPPSNFFQIDYNNTNFFSVQYDGNVGIGTTSPNYKLKVAGITSDIINTSGGQISGLPSVQTEPDQAVSRKYLHDNFLSTSTPTSTNFWGGSLLGNISNANSGNVGIGTTSPSNKLSVSGNADFTGNVGFGVSNPDGRLHLASLDHKDIFILERTNPAYAAKWEVGLANGRWNMGPYPQSTIDNRKFLVDTNGKVSLGVKPAEASWGGIANSLFVGGRLSIGNGILTHDNPQKALEVYGDSYISGNVGIGTTSPNYKLKVAGITSDIINTSGGQISGLPSVQTEPDQAVSRKYLHDNFLSTSTPTSTNFWGGSLLGNISNANSGNVGIGTTNPIAKLNVETNSLGVTVNNNSGLFLSNSSAASNGSQQISPSINWSGQGWASTPLASRNVSFISYLLPVQGTSNPSANLIFASSIAGGAYSTRLTLTSAGALTVGAGLSATTGAFSSTITNTRISLAITPTDGTIITNNTASTLAVPVQISPRLRLSGTAWNTGTSASNTMNWTIDNLSVSGNPPTSALRFNFDRHATGYSTALSLLNNGDLLVTGNVGINNSAPSYKLHLSGTTNTIIHTSGGQISGLPSVQTEPDQAVSRKYLHDNFLSTSTPTSTNFWGGSLLGNISNANSGNVGIGTTTPADKFQVYGNTFLGRISGYPYKSLWTWESDNTGYAAGIGYQKTDGTNQKLFVWWRDSIVETNINSVLNVAMPGHTFNGTHPNTGRTIGVSLSATGNSYFNAGNVVIGATTTSYKLQVSGGTGNVINSSGGQISGLPSVQTEPDQAVSRKYLHDNFSPTSTTFWKLSGNQLYASSTSWYVGIGTNNPGYLLDVDGTAQFAGIVMATSTNLNMRGGDIQNVDKLTVGTIDPLYRIKGINYSTFAAAIVGGVKEEYIGQAKINHLNRQGEYELIIDFSKQTKGSDLWVWRKVVDFKRENIEVLMTPYGRFAQIYYLIEGENLIFRSNRPVDISYRLIGRRHDWRNWPTKALDQDETPSFIID